mmetsp:Transcript_38904/g.98734  ORF Transcript_38904/g.98734 Transcript_38904/m.98734 type:complete len:215 (+) Transcript_38904:1131-1775(+)
MRASRSSLYWAARAAKALRSLCSCRSSNGASVGAYAKACMILHTSEGSKWASPKSAIALPNPFHNFSSLIFRVEARPMAQTSWSRASDEGSTLRRPSSETGGGFFSRTTRLPGLTGAAPSSSSSSSSPSKSTEDMPMRSSNSMSGGGADPRAEVLARRQPDRELGWRPAHGSESALHVEAHSCSWRTAQPAKDRCCNGRPEHLPRTSCNNTLAN